jgi:hypothetical protein
MYAANSPQAVAGGGRQEGLAVVVKVMTALGLAGAVWVGAMLLAATVGRLLLELVQWVGVLVLAVLGSGIRVPLAVVPHALAQLTAVWPAFHLAQFARYAVGNGSGVDLVPHVAGVVGIAVLFFALALRGLRTGR